MLNSLSVFNEFVFDRCWKMVERGGAIILDGGPTYPLPPPDNALTFSNNVFVVGWLVVLGLTAL